MKKWDGLPTFVRGDGTAEFVDGLTKEEIEQLPKEETDAFIEAQVGRAVELSKLITATAKEYSDKTAISPVALLLSLRILEKTISLGYGDDWAIIRSEAEAVFASMKFERNSVN